MKANAPEKIYFNRESIESIPDDDPLFNCLSIKENDDDIEYIRKDAFIEKTSWWIAKNIKKWYENIKVHGFRGMTSLMITEFKNYMEGE